MLAVAVNFAQLAARPIHSRLSLRKVSTVVPAFMNAWDTTVELCSTLFRDELLEAVSTAACVCIVHAYVCVHVMCMYMCVCMC